jgi:ubiquinone/menaquinone biosynthesis C-methylase UbiE
MQVVTRLQNALEYVLPLEPLFNIATVTLQAAAIEEHLAAVASQDESDLLAELESMSEEEAVRCLAAMDQSPEGKRHTSHWQTEGVSKAYLDVRSAIPGSELEVEVMLKLISTWCPSPKAVLDLGCGDGFLGRMILKHFPGCHVSFVDFSEPMLAAARDKLNGSEHATIIQADYTTLQWISHLRDESFDIVVSGLSIHHQTDVRKKQLYGEIHQLLTAGGVFFNLEQVASATDNIAAVYHDYLIDHLHAFHCQSEPAGSRDEIASGFYASPARRENILAPVETQCAWLQELGFRDVDCFFKVFEHALFGGRKAPLPPC